MGMNEVMDTDTTTAAVEEMQAIDLTPKPIYLSHEDAKDAAKYRRARALAEQGGQQLVILAREEPGPFTPPADTVVIPKDASTATYRAMKAQAEARGLAYMVHP